MVIRTQAVFCLSWKKNLFCLVLTLCWFLILQDEWNTNVNTVIMMKNNDRKWSKNRLHHTNCHSVIMFPHLAKFNYKFRCQKGVSLAIRQLGHPEVIELAQNRDRQIWTKHAYISLYQRFVWPFIDWFIILLNFLEVVCPSV